MSSCFLHAVRGSKQVSAYFRQINQVQAYRGSDRIRSGSLQIDLVWYRTWRVAQMMK